MVDEATVERREGELTGLPLRLAIDRQALALATRLRKHCKARALYVEMEDFWDFGDWLRGLEENGAEQRACGNMTRGMKGGRGSCDVLTSCQADITTIRGMLLEIRRVMEESPEGQFKLVAVSDGKVVLDKEARKN